jgi:beta-glucosidase
VSTFSSDFLFGASMSAYQNEGSDGQDIGRRNDWGHWEEARARRLAARAPRKDYGQGRVTNLPPEALRHSTYLAGAGTGHYRRYREDLDLAQRIGLTAFRFALEWSRIEPEPGCYDEDAIQHYRDVSQACRERGMEPFVTVWHFTLPLWAEALGGWESEAVVSRFVRLASVVASRLGDVVTFWATICEPETYAMMTTLPYVIGKDDSWLDYRQGVRPFLRVRRHLVAAHRHAYRAVKSAHPELQVGITLNFVHYDGWQDPVSRALRRVMWRTSNGYFAPRVADAVDWFGLQYYFHCRVKVTPFRNDFDRRSDLGWELYPEGHAPVLRDIARFGKPVYVTESGLADRHDRYRAWYITESLSAIGEAIDAGVDCRGYFHWTLTDNFEWDKGWWPRFGLVEIDRDDGMRRVPRASAAAYADIVRARRL